MSATTIILGAIVMLIWFTFLSILRSRLSPADRSNGVQQIASSWKDPSYRPLWRADFTRDIIPVQCHSHNDYWRDVPLYNALSVGCTGVEADVWLSETDDGPDLFVGHNEKVLTPERTFRSLYIEPLVEILMQQQKPLGNISSSSPLSESSPYGVYDVDPSASLALLVDFKTNGNSTWPLVSQQLDQLRKQDWLTYWNGTDIISRPIAVVATGNAPFDRILDAPRRDIFYDAPLLNLTSEYNISTSYYASTPMKEALGKVSWPSLSSAQVGLIGNQIAAAEQKGLKSRYWDTPSWPVSLRNDIWTQLASHGVGMLNVDELIPAARWSWNWCIIAGITLCE